MVGSYSLGAILQKWEKGELSTEQTMGQTLLVILELSNRVGNLERRVIGERPSLVERPSPPSPKEDL